MIDPLTQFSEERQDGTRIVVVGFHPVEFERIEDAAKAVKATPAALARLLLQSAAECYVTGFDLLDQFIVAGVGPSPFLDDLDIE